MKLIVGINKVTFDETDKLNAGEYNIHDVEFEFDEVYDELIKKAVFSGNGHSYLVDIVNNRCIMPYEVLSQTGDISVGAFGYAVDGQDLVLRYSPSPSYLHVDMGTYRDSYDNYQVPTADIVEQLTNRIETAEAIVEGYDDRLTAVENDKVDKVEGKGLSTNDYTDSEKTKLASLENYDDTEIKADITDLQNNKANTSDLATVATSGSYDDLTNKPTIPDVSNFITKDVNNLTYYYTKTETDNKIPDVSGFITKNVNDLTYYTLKTSTGSLIDLEINSSTYVVTLSLKDIDGNVISTDTIDLPLESVVVSGSFDSTNKKIVLTLQNGNTVDIPVGDLVAGLQTEITSSNKLASDLVDDSNSGNKFVTSSEKTTWNAKYDKPSGGIPASDLASGVIPDLTNYVTKTDYASGSNAGIIKVYSSRGLSMLDDTALQALVKTYSEYASFSNNGFISKGTLENVITGKDLTTKSYVDGLVGDIATALDTIQGEVI